jgi:multiple sugar transport system ATP-binding protein
MARVILENLSKIYPGERGREVIAVEDLSLEIEDKEFMVFVGPSGCGKSTTLRMIAGLEGVSRGKIYIDGREVNDVPPKDRDIAMVFQNYALYPHMTVYKNMAFGLQLRKRPKSEIDQRVREAAEILELTDEMLQRRPRTLSGGQSQRVALGRAIVRKPQVFLFDEPLSNLDAKMRVQMRGEISRLHRRLSTTMIYVTHDQVEAMTMADRICLMKDGRIQQVDRPLDIYNYPANMFVASFIGSPPMNLFAGTLQDEHGDLIFLETEDKSGLPSLDVQVSAERVEALVPWVGKSLYLGLRPEDFEVRTAWSGVGPGRLLSAMVEAVELMGAESYLHLRTAQHAFVIRAGAQSGAVPGERIELYARMEKAHFFNAADSDLYMKTDGALDWEKYQAACRRIV